MFFAFFKWLDLHAHDRILSTRLTQFRPLMYWARHISRGEFCSKLGRWRGKSRLVILEFVFKIVHDLPQMIFFVFQVQILYHLVYLMLASFDVGTKVLYLEFAIHGNLVTIIISHNIGQFVILLIIIVLHHGKVQLSLRVFRVFFNIS